MLKRWLTPASDSLMQSSFKRGKTRWMQGFNLVWLMWVFGDLLFGQPLGRWWVPGTGVTLVLFLLLYALANLRPMREMLGYSLAMAVMGYVTMLFNHSGGTTYIIFACAILAFQGAPRRSFTLIAAVVLLFVLEAIVLHWPWQVIVMMSMISIAVGGGNCAYWVNSQKEAELRLSHDEVRRLAATAERERIGRDLHDLLGHTLSLITLKLELSRKLFDRDIEAAKREVEEAEKVARHALAEVRSAVTGIRATDLAAELASARLLLASSDVHLDYGQPPMLPLEVERGLSLILREAVTNIARHARASRARIDIQCEQGAARLHVSDDGRGGVGVDGNGLCGMRERVRALGGTLAIDSPRGHGTVLNIRVPLPAQARNVIDPKETAAATLPTGATGSYA